MKVAISSTEAVRTFGDCLARINLKTGMKPLMDTNRH